MRSSWHNMIHSVCWWIFLTINCQNWRKFVHKNHVIYWKHWNFCPLRGPFAAWMKVKPARPLENCVLHPAIDLKGQFVQHAEHKHFRQPTIRGSKPLCECRAYCFVCKQSFTLLEFVIIYFVKWITIFPFKRGVGNWKKEKIR